MKYKKLIIILLTISLLITACLAKPVKKSLRTDVSDQNEAQTYINEKYQFTVQVPSTWRVMELPTPDYPAATDQVWFVSEALPQPQTGSRADIVFIFTQDDPSPSWEPQYLTISSQTFSGRGIYRPGGYRESTKKASFLRSSSWQR